MSPFTALLKTAFDLAQEMDQFHGHLTRAEDEYNRASTQYERSSDHQVAALLLEKLRLSDQNIGLLKKLLKNRKEQIRELLAHVNEAL